MFLLRKKTKILESTLNLDFSQALHRTVIMRKFSKKINHSLIIYLISMRNVNNGLLSQCILSRQLVASKNTKEEYKLHANNETDEACIICFA